MLLREASQRILKIMLLGFFQHWYVETLASYKYGLVIDTTREEKKKQTERRYPRIKAKNMSNQRSKQ